MSKQTKQFYICLLAKTYMNTIINMSLYIDDNLKFCLWKWARGGCIM